MTSASIDAALQTSHPEQLLRDARPPGTAAVSGGKCPAPPRSLGFLPVQGLPTPTPPPPWQTPESDSQGLTLRTRGESKVQNLAVAIWLDYETDFSIFKYLALSILFPAKPPWSGICHFAGTFYLRL